MKDDNLICSVCGAVLDGEHIHEFDGQLMCEQCLDEHMVVCDNCHERIWRDNAEGDSLSTLCSHCYQYCYTTCERCGVLIRNDDAYYEDDDDVPYCYDCYRKLEESAIKSYNYKPDPIFYGSGNLFYGVELEIDKLVNEEEKQNIIEAALESLHKWRGTVNMKCGW